MVSDFSKSIGQLRQDFSMHPVIAKFEQLCSEYCADARGITELAEHIGKLSTELDAYRSLYLCQQKQEILRDYRDKMHETNLELLIEHAVLCRLKRDEGGADVYKATAVFFHTYVEMLSGYENPQSS